MGNLCDCLFVEYEPLDELDNSVYFSLKKIPQFQTVSMALAIY